MQIMKTEKETLTESEILDVIWNYEKKEVPELDKYWEYYKGKNVSIIKRKKADPNNPDNKLIVSYGRKLINTYTGYGYRPRYISYHPNIKIEDIDFEDESDEKESTSSVEKYYLSQIKAIFEVNNEHIKTNRAGRNTAIFGLSYEVLYIDREFDIYDKDFYLKAVPKFFTVDPRELILLYDYDPEPKPKIGIRFFKMDSVNKYKVEVYYKDEIIEYLRERKDEYDNTWTLTRIQSYPNYFEEIPIIAYYMGDEIQSIMSNVLTLIDAYDVLFSDSMNEFDRFAFAYLVMKKISLTNPIDKKDPTKFSSILELIKKRRVFEGLDKDADIKFLTKDIPTSFIQYMAKEIREQIHIQSHIPDFTNEKMNGASGIAIQRLMFDFENLVSSAEADFDIGLYNRIALITHVMKKLKNDFYGSPEMIRINHKRNVPLNTLEFAQTAMIMSNAKFSRRAIVGIMPEDIIPNVEKELQYEKEEEENLLGYGLQEGNLEEKSQEETPEQEIEEV